MSLKSKKLFVDGWTDGHTDGHLRPTLLDRLGGVDRKTKSGSNTFRIRPKPRLTKCLKLLAVISYQLR